jgi:hypothetical protein
MPRNSHKRDPIPEEFSSIEQAAAFWETHDLTDYEDVWHDAGLRVNLKRAERRTIELEPQIADEFTKLARAKRTSLGNLVNRALKDYLKRTA